jgi:flavin reductase (DIM6/NTAB) family NADH-FMN oxidoreductase RutF
MLQAEIAELIKTLSTGIYGIGVHDVGEDRIFTASWVMPVSFDPVLVALSINPVHRSYDLLNQSGSFSINVIGMDRADLAEKMAAPGDRLKALSWSRGTTGCPLLESAIAQLECRVIHDYPAGDHQIVVGKVIQGKVRRPKESPLLYRDTGNLDDAIMLFPEKLEPC